VSPSELQTFASEALFDQKTAALAVEAGDTLSLQTAIELGAQTEAIYVLTSLEGRGLDFIEQHRLLWQKAAQFFEDAIAIWQTVPTDGELLNAHLQLLTELCALSRDRVEFYSVSESERRAVVKLD
jgi:hypothetical protein